MSTRSSSRSVPSSPLRPIRRIALCSILALSLGSCADSSAETETDENKAATVVVIGDTGFSRVTLTEDSAKRIRLQTAKVVGDGISTTIPFAAVLYDPYGQTWTFVREKGLTFVRKAIAVTSVTGDVALLSSGPAVGTEVATVGAVQLYGAEIGVGDE